MSKLMRHMPGRRVSRHSKANTFPAAEHCFKDVGEEVLDKLY